MATIYLKKSHSSQIHNLDQVFCGITNVELSRKKKITRETNERRRKEGRKEGRQERKTKYLSDVLQILDLNYSITNDTTSKKMY